MKKILTIIQICILVSLTLLSCGEDRTYEYLEKTKENQWIYSTMKETYLWREQIKAPEQSQFFVATSKFFSSLLTNGDKASFFTDALLTGDYGMRVTLMRDPIGIQPSRVYALVLDVEPESPAGKAGIERGAWISAVNGKALTMSGKTLLEQGEEADLAMEYIDFDDESERYLWTVLDTITIASSTPYEKCNINHDAILNEGDRRIGYFLCNGFDGNDFKENTDKVMEEFIAGNVTDIVIDLRYNSGGAMENVAYIAGMLVPPSLVNTPFAILKDINEEVDTVYNYTPSSLNIGDKRVFFIIGEATKGTAELLVRSVDLSRDTYDVIIVGEKSAGSNVIAERFDSPYGFAINPATAVLYTSDGSIMSSDGITPDCKADELGQKPYVYPLGSKQEYLLYNIMHYILEGAFPE